MLILGIETSCDETAAAVVKDGHEILSNVVVSQIDIFAAYGGVIPEVAARSHLEAILPVIDKALKDAHTTWSDIDAIAVTHAPGLLGSLLIGTLTARTLAILLGKPLYAVHHLKSHIYANWLNASPVPFPLLALVISGGHTQILYMKRHNDFEIIGTTRDDAIGECFDKVAKILGLPYPGGPAIAKAATAGAPSKYKFPHPKVDALDFSFSGLKIAVLRTVQKELNLPLSHPSHDLKNHLTPTQVADFAASFQKTAIDILLEKLNAAQSEHPDAKSLVFAGGVSANAALRSSMADERVTAPKGDPHGAPSDVGEEAPAGPARRIYFPAPQFSGDNGAMVAAAAYYEIESGVKPTDPYTLNIYPRIPIDSQS